MARLLQLLILAWIGLSGPLACARFSRESASAETRTLSHQGFDRIELSDDLRAEIVHGERFSVRVEGPAHRLDALQVVQRGDTLSLGADGRQRSNLTVHLVVPRLRGLSLHGATQAEVSGFSSWDSLDLVLHGASRLRAGLRAGEVQLRLQGASHAAIAGSCRSLQVFAGGASRMELAKFEAESLMARVTGAVEGSLFGTTLDVTVDGASTVRLRGERIEQLQVDGAATVHVPRAVATDSARVGPGATLETAG